MPGDNEYGTWGSRYDDKRQWKLCNGQWVRVAEPKPKPKPKYEKYLAERVKCKPQKPKVARTEPVRKIKPQSGSTDDPDSDLDRSYLEQPNLVDSRNRSPPLDRTGSLEPDRRRRQVPLLEEPVELDALRDKYRPKEAEKPSYSDEEVDTKPDSKQPTGTILLEPIRPPTPPLEEIKVEPITPTYVEMKKPLKSK